MPLSDIVNVVITRQTQTITEQGFGTPMILGPSQRFTDLIKFYTDMDEVALDFSANDPEYIAAQDIFSQTISPDLIAIGRRQVDDVTISVETALSGQDYVLNIDGNELIIDSTPTTTYSIATLNGDLVTGNKIAVTVDATPVSVTSTIDFSADFVASNSIAPTVNGTLLTPSVIFTTDQATTIGLVAAKIATGTGVTSATVTGPRQITVVFSGPIANIVNSVVTTLGASQPTATITQIGFVFATSHLATMNAIAAAIEAKIPADSANVSGATNRILSVIGPINTTTLINSFVVTGGASQAVATITNPLQPATRESIALAIVTEINSQPSGYPVTAIDNGDGTFDIINANPGSAYTLRVSTTIGNPNSALVRVTQVTPNATYTVTLNGIDYTYVAQNNVQTANDIVTALVDLINLEPRPVPVTATNLNDGTFQIQSDISTETFSIFVSIGTMTYDKGLLVLPLVAANAVADDLTDINDANSSWYALIATERTVQTVKDIADWVEARIKLFGTASADANIINIPAGTDTTSIAAFLNQAGYVRTFVMYHQDALYDYPEAAWFGRVLPLEPGSETWKFKTLNTISYSNLTTTQSLNALNKKANTYEFVAGVGITANGTVAQGEYIDIVRGIDWLTARIQEYVFSVLVNNPKVPYTNAGIATIQAEVMRVLQLGVNNNFLTSDPQPICTVPLAQDVPPADKANRILRNVRFQATLAGAIHVVFIKGVISV